MFLVAPSATLSRFNIAAPASGSGGAGVATT
jgi:hypothetical protein